MSSYYTHVVYKKLVSDIK